MKLAMKEVYDPPTVNDGMIAVSPKVQMNIQLLKLALLGTSYRTFSHIWDTNTNVYTLF